MIFLLYVDGHLEGQGCRQIQDAQQAAVEFADRGSDCVIEAVGLGSRDTAPVSRWRFDHDFSAWVHLSS